MNDVVQMAILQSAPYLPRELPGDPFPQSTMADDVVEHLTTVNVFENHVVVVLVDNHFAHSADVGVIQEHGEGGLAEGSDFLGCVL